VESGKSGESGSGRDLPEEFATALAAYERHLVSERDLTPHTVRAYMGDVAGMLAHASAMSLVSLDELDIRTLRSWLANQQTLGKARTTMARRATAIRVFTAWALRTGRTSSDAGAQLGSPKAHKPLPAALDVAQARALLATAATRADDGSPVGLRDVAILELLYATGARVGEICGLDIDDADGSRRVIRVFGKGRKERTSRASVGRVARGPPEAGGSRERRRPVLGRPRCPDRPAGGSLDGAPPVSRCPWRP
jgi:integrase/recombinase XerC